MNIVMASAEVSPFARTGGLGDVLGAVPKALARRGHQVTVFTPFYRQTREYFDRTGEVLESLGELILTWAGWVARVELLKAKLRDSDVAVIFIGSDTLFDRETLYAMRPDGFDDHLERFTVFCRAVLAATERLAMEVDVLHAHDWHAALLPIYADAERIPAATVYTIHNLNYQGRYGAARFIVLGLDRAYLAPEGLEYFGDLNLMKGGIVYADQVTTVSPTYAREIQTPDYGAGLDGVLRIAAPKLSGILNGIDVEEWNPRSDPAIPANFGAENLEGKTRCKRELRKEAELRGGRRGPLICAISRLVEQKGIDLLIPVISRLVDHGCQVVVLGSGEPDLEEALRGVEALHRGEVRAFLTFDPALAHRIIAGSDLLVMPSRYEPCGLNQMYASRYATLPAVRLTGGLADTVTPYDGTNADIATGFGFQSPDAHSLHRELWLASLMFKNRILWRKLQRNGMARDFSWDASARQYERVYERAVQVRLARGR
jgi:starch synthase